MSLETEQKQQGLPYNRKASLEGKVGVQTLQYLPSHQSEVKVTSSVQTKLQV